MSPTTDLSATLLLSTDLSATLLLSTDLSSKDRSKTMPDVDWEDESVPKLLPCKLCGGTNFELRSSRMPPTMERDGQVISAEIYHYCNPDLRMGGLRLQVRERDAVAAAELWNSMMSEAANKQEQK